ncbi:MAG: hypothetical protein ABIH46_10925 [Chloroflexota bacterium]
MAKIRKGYRGSSGTGIGFGSTEGEGLYIARTRELAEFFAGEDGAIIEVHYEEPRKMLLVENEPLPILEELELIEDPIRPFDSIWIRLNKMAYRQARVKAGNFPDFWDQDAIAHELTKLINARGFDGVRITSGGGEWDVVFSPKITKTRRL